MNPFCERHIHSILTESKEVTPLDAQLRIYFRGNKSIGARDRRIISEVVYGFCRWKGLIDFHAKGKSLQEKIATYLHLSKENFTPLSSIPPHTSVSFPKELFEALKAAYGERTESICRSLNKQAPPTIRANPLKIKRDALLKRLSQYAPMPTSHAPMGITFPKRENFFGMPEFKEGLFEMQDEGSQILAEMVNPKPGDHVLDYCAGAGGKTLAFAYKLKGKGQLYLHDVREHALIDARKRMKRAGIQNAQIVSSKALKKSGMLNRMDWMLLDVPCSGTGTLRRNPDMKWRLTKGLIDEFVSMQRVIFEKAFKHVKKHGYIVYATCSILPKENQEQVAYFLEKYPIALVKKPFASLPEDGGMDGFFGAVFKKLEDES